MGFPDHSNSREVLPGIFLDRSELGGFSVRWGKVYIGWIHAADNDSWNAYVRQPRPAASGRRLGTFQQLDAVRVIAVESGWRSQS